MPGSTAGARRDTSTSTDLQLRRCIFRGCPPPPPPSIPRAGRRSTSTARARRPPVRFNRMEMPIRQGNWSHDLRGGSLAHACRCPPTESARCQRRASRGRQINGQRGRQSRKVAFLDSLDRLHTTLPFCPSRQPTFFNSLSLHPPPSPPLASNVPSPRSLALASRSAWPAHQPGSSAIGGGPAEHPLCTTRKEERRPHPRSTGNRTPRRRTCIAPQQQQQHPQQNHSPRPSARRPPAAMGPLLVLAATLAVWAIAAMSGAL